MKISPLPIDGAYLIEMEPHHDSRGYFARFFDKEIFEAHGLESVFVQWSLSSNKDCGTLRGMHFQKGVAAETKLVHCVSGKIFDVIADLRPDSKTLGKTFSITLDAKINVLLYIPSGCAHGFQTLEDDVNILYYINKAYNPLMSSGVRFSDPTLNISWPISNPIISKKDLDLPLWRKS